MIDEPTETSVVTLVELLSEEPEDTRDIDAALLHSVTRTGDGQTNPDE